MAKAKQKATPAFTHGGVNIYANSTVEFVATIDGKRVTKPSLAAMKKHIDGRTPFVPFDALDSDGKPIKVIGIREGRQSRYGRKSTSRWIIKDAIFDESAVYVDTPANRKAVAAYNAHNEKTGKLMDECNRKSSQLLAKIKSITPDEKA